MHSMYLFFHFVHASDMIMGCIIVLLTARALDGLLTVCNNVLRCARITDL